MSASATDIIPFSADAEPLRHGGDLSAARRLFPSAVEPFIDLSTGINPHPYPLPDLASDLFTRLPEEDAAKRLAGVAAKAYGAPSANHVLPAPGTQILLPLVPGLAPPGRAAIVGPTYSEHARAAVLAGHVVSEVGDIGAVGDAGLVVITNPNNPDGRLWSSRDLSRLAERLQARGGILIVDEAFMDVAPAASSLAGEVGRGNIVVLRSFGKFFGLAGLRLGFALAAPALLERLSARLGPWAVSGPALAVGAAALADHAWIEATRGQLAQAVRRLDAILRRSNFTIVGGTSLFRLVRAAAAPALFQHFGRAGILVRVFRDHRTWLRFGLPATEAEWLRLQNALETIGGDPITMAAAPDNG